MRIPVLFATVILFAGLVSSLEVLPKYDTNILVEELENPIEFSLEIIDAPRGEYNVYTLSDLTIEPSEIFEIFDNNVTLDFVLSPNENFAALGLYTFTYTLHHRNVEKIDQKFTLNVLSLEEVLEISSDSIDPSSGKVSFYVRNKEDVDLSNLTARFSSVLFDISEKFNLKAKERKEFPVKVDPDKLKRTKAGVYIIDSVFETKKGNVKIQGNLYLGEKKGIKTTEDDGGFLIYTRIINKINSGNILENVEVKVKKDIISRLFTSFNVEPNFVNRDGFVVEYTWMKRRLGPGEVFTVKARTNYLLPFIIVVFFIVLFVIIKNIVQRKLEVVKSVNHVRTKNGEFALRVKIYIRAKKSVENVSVIDRVPRMVKIYKKFGSLKPDKIDLESRRLHWHLGDLDVGEERSFNYIVYSKVGYVGKFSLPRALLVFEENNEIHEVESNKVFFMSDQVKGEQ